MFDIMKGFIVLLIASEVAVASPSHFFIVVGSALVCRDQVSAEYFNDYMNTYFGKPAFNAGGANWWKVDEKLFNAEVQYVFVGADRDFIGATYKDEPVELISKVKGSMGIDYKQMGVEKWVASSDSVIIKYHDKSTPSKMYCIGSPHTPN